MMTTPNPTPRPHEHDWHSRAYVDEWIASSNSRASTRGPELAALARLLPYEPGDAIRVLDVGGGHGELTAAVLEAWPQAAVTVQDFSEPMLESARARFADSRRRVNYVRSDLSEPGWSSSCHGPFDAVVSAIAIHNVGNPQIIQSIYSEIFNILLKPGAFFNLDYCFTSGPGMSSLYARLLDRSTATRAGSTRPERDDEPASLASQLRWLEELGFDEVDCIWKRERRALLCGLRH